MKAAGMRDPALDGLHRRMQLVRVLEERLQGLCDIGEAGDLHLNRGQEAVSIGVCAALRPSDLIVVHHRTISHAVAKGVPLYPLVAEILGKADGLCGGMSGEMHMSCPEAGFMFSFQLVGTCVPVAAGIAWAARHHCRTDDVVAVFHGDAATSNGQWHEGAALATLKRAPLLMICEDNGLAGNVRRDSYMPTGTVAERAIAHGIAAERIDGTHMEDVLAAAREAAARVRETSRPFLLECDVPRLSWHKQGQRDARPPEEIAALALRCPLLHLADLLGLDEGERASRLAEAKEQVDAVIARARMAPPPCRVRDV